MTSTEAVSRPRVERSPADVLRLVVALAAALCLVVLERLFAASGAEWAEPPQPADPRRGPARRVSATDPTVC